MLQRGILLDSVYSVYIEYVYSVLIELSVFSALPRLGSISSVYIHRAYIIYEIDLRYIDFHCHQFKWLH